MAVITVDELTKRYAGASATAVADVSFTVADREFMVLLGPSGCGKSTVLRMIAGLEPISAGTVSIDGRVVNDVPAKSRDIAMVFQSYALYPHMTVYDNLAFGLRRRSVERAEIARRVQAAAAKLRLTEFLERKPYALSGGQRQRVALGRAIVRDPKLFLFDEPLSNLDAALRVSTRNELIRQQREIGTTSSYVTHDQVEAMTMGDRIVVMSKGQIQQIDTPLGLYNEPRNLFVAGFIGSPAINLVEGTVDGVQFRAANEGVTLPLTDDQSKRLSAFAGKPIVAGARPEALYLPSSPRPNGPFGRVSLPIVAVEPLGNEALLYARLGAKEITARVAPRDLPEPGQVVELLVDLSKVMYFDSSSGLRI